MGALPRIGYASPIAVAPRGVGLSPSPCRGKFKIVTGDSSACIFQNAVMLNGGWGYGAPHPLICLYDLENQFYKTTSVPPQCNYSCYLKIEKMD